MIPSGANEYGTEAMSIRKGDIVKVTVGKDRGKEGAVLAVNPSRETVMIEGVHLVKRHVKPNQRNQKGGIIEKESPLHISNVKLIQKAE